MRPEDRYNDRKHTNVEEFRLSSTAFLCWLPSQEQIKTFLASYNNFDGHSGGKKITIPLFRQVLRGLHEGQ